jgi:hypothetical protein
MDFDCYVKYELGMKYYGRYVDDFAIVHKGVSSLRCLPVILNNYLKTNLGLKIHPNKTQIRHFSEGVDFLGGYIKPGRIYVRNRTKGNFYKSVRELRKMALEKKGNFSKKELLLFENRVNSYLGTLGNFNTLKLKRKIMKQIGGYWENYFYYSQRKDKLCRKRR